MSNKKRWVALPLAFALLFSCIGTSAAADNEAKTMREEKIEGATLNVTVPLYVCMYAYGKTGTVVVPDDGAYSIKNNSRDEEYGYDVKVSQVSGTNVDMTLSTDHRMLYKDELFLQLNGTPVTNEPSDINWIIDEPVMSNGAITAAGELPVKIEAAIGNGLNTFGEKKACYVTYKFELVWPYYEIHYDMNDSLLKEADRREDYTDILPDSIYFHNDESFYVPNMAYDGYIFKGWNSEPDGTGRTFSPGAETTVWEDTTLYAQWARDWEASLHFSSDYLADPTEGKSYNVVAWEDGIDIELYNCELENEALVSADTTDYVVTVTGGTVDRTSGTFGSNKETVKLHITPTVGYNGTILVSVKASNEGAEKTLSAAFNLTSKNYAEYTVTQNEDGTSLLKIVTNDYSGKITVVYNNAPPDNTNNLMQSWKTDDKQHDIEVQPNTIYELLFFGKLKATSGTIQYGSAGTITLS